MAVRSTVLGLSLVLLVAPAARSQDTLPPREGGLTHSLGQPRRLRFTAGGSIGGDWYRGTVTPVGFVNGAVFRSFGNPVVGLLGASVEGFAGFRGQRADLGFRGLLVSQSLRVAGGAEINVHDSRVAPIVGFTVPVRRGGVFGGGSVLRLEWLPGSGTSVRVAAMAPVREPWAGHTRPRASEVSLPLRERPPPPKAAPPALAEVLATVRTAAHRVADVIVPFTDASGTDPARALAPMMARLQSPPSLPGYRPDGTVGTEQTVRIYHREIDRAFSIAAGGDPALESPTPEGEELSRRARAILLDHVLFPFNRLLGQKKNGDALRALGRHARGNWARELVAGNGLSPDREAAILGVFERLLDLIDEVRAEQLKRWRDSRVLWLPLQFALRPEDHDHQAELDRIVEAALGQQFTDGNQVWYVINGQFQQEVSRSILAAQDYHVLWIHDFAGRNKKGEPDPLSLRYVADTYLGALTAAIQRYDERRTLPMYLVFLDEHYYEANQARLWLEFLERPLGPRPRLPRGYEAFDSTLAAAQAALRQAVATSRLLQAEASQYGKAWLDNLVKVHVSITNPADPSFLGRDVLPIIGFPDNMMRDHRKIAFYDVSEEDPYRGLAIYTGMGIGAHYSGPTWEDRAIMAKGPVLGTLKEQARRLLRSHGLGEAQIPYPLRPRPKAPDYDDRVRRFVADRPGGQGHGHDQRAMELHNLTGYQDKPINVAKATLYTLMPPGSVIKAPDSIWGSALWASLLTGSALRGNRVLVVAPSLASAPSSGWPTMGVAHDVFSRLIVLQQQLGAEIAAAGGMLKTGIYNPGIGVEDALSRFAAAYQNARRTPFLRRLFPVDPSIDSMLVRYRASAMASPTTVLSSPPVAPKLHLKANWFSSREAWDSLIGHPEMKGVLEA